MSGGRSIAVYAAAFCLLFGGATARSQPQVLPVRASGENTIVVTLPTGPKQKATGIAVPIPAALSPVTPSRLVSRPDLTFALAEGQLESVRVTFLMHRPSGRTPTPVAVISAFQVGDKPHIRLERLLPGGSKAQRSDIEIATIEHLYSLAFGQDPEAMYCLVAPGRKCGRAEDDYSHARLLRELRDDRQAAMTRTGRTGNNVPWLVVAMAPAVQGGATDDDVAVLVASDGKPMEGASVFFHRAPHSGCGAKASPDGLAACRLVDRHGDDESHAEEEKAPVLATFPGNVSAERVLLPTTLVVSPRP